jgi:hypothetical protein
VSNKIDLNYISAHDVKDFLYNPYDFIIDKLSKDIGTIEGYINKYDNKWDKMEGTDVEALKEAKTKLFKILDKIREIEKE